MNKFFLVLALVLVSPVRSWHKLKLKPTFGQSESLARSILTFILHLLKLSTEGVVQGMD
jgi:hypothetical protein